MAHGEQRSVCSIFGALNDAFSSMRASWAGSNDKRPRAVSSSEQRLARSSSVFFPPRTGAPKSSVSSGLREIKPSKCAAGGMDPRLIISHLEALMRSPVSK